MYVTNTDIVYDLALNIQQAGQTGELQAVRSAVKAFFENRDAQAVMKSNPTVAKLVFQLIEQAGSNLSAFNNS